MSRVGKQPVLLPQGVDINILNNTILVKGKKGELKNSFPDLVKIVKEDNKIEEYNGDRSWQHMTEWISDQL